MGDNLYDLFVAIAAGGFEVLATENPQQWIVSAKGRQVALIHGTEFRWF